MGVEERRLPQDDLVESSSEHSKIPKGAETLAVPYISSILVCKCQPCLLTTEV